MNYNIHTQKMSTDKIQKDKEIKIGQFKNVLFNMNKGNDDE